MFIHLINFKEYSTIIYVSAHSKTTRGRRKTVGYDDGAEQAERFAGGREEKGS